MRAGHSSRAGRVGVAAAGEEEWRGGTHGGVEEEVTTVVTSWGRGSSASEEERRGTYGGVEEEVRTVV